MAESIRVLHVDDEPSFLELAAEFLADADSRLEIRTESSPDDGLAALDSRPVDCVISDYQMGGTNGIEFLESVREIRPAVPFILFTSVSSETVVPEAMSAGATDYLQKRTDTEQFQLLATRVVNAVDRYRTHRELQALRRRVETGDDRLGTPTEAGEPTPTGHRAGSPPLTENRIDAGELVDD